MRRTLVAAVLVGAAGLTWGLTWLKEGAPGAKSSGLQSYVLRAARSGQPDAERILGVLVVSPDGLETAVMESGDPITSIEAMEGSRLLFHVLDSEPVSVVAGSSRTVVVSAT